MSTSTILAVTPGRSVVPLFELRNAHGLAPVVWDALSQKYLGLSEHQWINRNSAPLWSLADRMDIPEHHRAVLMMTFDHSYVLKRDFIRAAGDIRQWLSDFPPKPGYVNHWPTLAVVYDGRPNAKAIAIHQTSVSENPWSPPLGKPRDWSKFYSVYEAPRFGPWKPRSIFAGAMA